MGLAVNKWRN